MKCFELYLIYKSSSFPSLEPPYEYIYMKPLHATSWFFPGVLSEIACLYMHKQSVHVYIFSRKGINEIESVRIAWGECGSLVFKMLTWLSEGCQLKSQVHQDPTVGSLSKALYFQ